jgi:myo-inositol 2-dehydrogenase/D-chiro-inositol 1-dehydrogenase
MSIAVGVIGAGIMGSDHARTLATVTRGASLAAVSDTDRARATALAEATKVGRVHADGFELIADPSVDAVLIASPDPTHEALVLACLAAGKPVLCEKPLSPDLEGCRRVVEAETAGPRRLVQVGFMRRFDPGYRAMQAALVGGEVGAPVLMHCIHRNAASPPSFTSPMLVSNSAVHEIDIARWLLNDEFAAATVFTGAGRRSGGLLDPQLIVLETRQGCLVEIEVFVNARYGYDVRAELVCESGTLTLEPRAPVRLRGSLREAGVIADDWRRHFAEAYRAQLQAWLDSIRSGVPDGANAWDGYAATATAAACLEALETGRRTAVELPPRPAAYG